MTNERRPPREINLVTENPQAITEDDSHEDLSPAHPPAHLGHALVILGRQWRKGDPIGGESNPAGTSHAAVDDDICRRLRANVLLGPPDERLLYFWCSKRSRLIGSELLCKMKDLLERRPSLSQLTRISQQRLDSFAAHLCTYFPRLPLSIEAFPPPDCSIRSYTKDRRASTVSDDAEASADLYY